MKNTESKALLRALGGLLSLLLLLGAVGVRAQPVIETVPYFTFGSTNDHPAGSLVLGLDDGVLYGTVSGENGHNDGAIFRVNRDGSGFQILHFFGADAPGVSAPRFILSSLLLGSDGYLYGST